VKLRFLTSGESHGPSVQVILEGLPAGFSIDLEAIDHELSRRQTGAGRGGRMRIEKDRVRVLSGLRHGVTLGSPLCLQVENIDHKNWAVSMSPIPLEPKCSSPEVRTPRPGHADLAGSTKYGHHDLRNTIERSSARETVNRVLLGAVAKQFLAQIGLCVASHVQRLSSIESTQGFLEGEDLSLQNARLDADPMRCLCQQTSAAMQQLIQETAEAGDTLGGVVEVLTTALPLGLGSHVHWDRRLDARLGAALLSLPSAKGLELGDAFSQAASTGREAHDEIHPAPNCSRAYQRFTNHAGGLEGGMTNGEPLRLRVAFKPLPTLAQPLQSVCLDGMEAAKAHRERSDTCAVVPASIIAEAVVAWVLFEALMENYGADRFDTILENLRSLAAEA
jgi:chorismate synthase